MNSKVFSVRLSPEVWAQVLALEAKGFSKAKLLKMGLLALHPPQRVEKPPSKPLLKPNACQPQCIHKVEQVKPLSTQPKMHEFVRVETPPQTKPLEEKPKPVPIIPKAEVAQWSVYAGNGIWLPCKGPCPWKL